VLKLGENVKKLRTEKNMSQSELARCTFKDRQSIERLENAKINPSIWYLKEVADAMNISLAVCWGFDSNITKSVIVE
jgi:putative transcriptional regulator